MKVLGIDPGSKKLGYAVIELCSNSFRLMDSQCITFNGRSSFDIRLVRTARVIREVATYYNPEEVAVEEPFLSVNAKTAMKLGQVVGVIKAALLDAGYEVVTYEPRTVRKTVSGYGGATKVQMNRLIKSLLNLDEKDFSFDESDAAAVALCHIFNIRKGQVTK